MIGQLLGQRVAMWVKNSLYGVNLPSLYENVDKSVATEIKTSKHPDLGSFDIEREKVNHITQPTLVDEVAQMSGFSEKSHLVGRMVRRCAVMASSIDIN